MTAEVKVKITGDSKGLVDANKQGEESFKRLGAAAETAGRVITGGLIWKAIQGTATALLDASIAAQKLRSSLEFSSGSIQGAGRDLLYLRDVTNRIGLDFGTASQAFVKLSAAAQGTAMAGEETRAIFEAVSKAGTVLGMSAEEMNGALLAIGQMMSKGTVQAEELRGQLGERLPGAFNIAARAMGVTTSELGKMLESGTVLASDFLPKFRVELDKAFGAQAQSAAQGLNAEVNRLKGSWEALKQSMGESKAFTTPANFLIKDASGYFRDMKAVLEDGDWFDKAALLMFGWTTPSMAARTGKDKVRTGQEIWDALKADKAAADPMAGVNAARAKNQTLYGQWLTDFQKNNEKAGKQAQIDQYAKTYADLQTSNPAAYTKGLEALKNKLYGKEGMQSYEASMKAKVEATKLFEGQALDVIKLSNAQAEISDQQAVQSSLEIKRAAATEQIALLNKEADAVQKADPSKAVELRAEADQVRLGLVRDEIQAKIELAGIETALRDARDKDIEASLGPLREQAAQLEQQVQTYGMLPSEIEATTIARLSEIKAILAGDGLSTKYLDAELEYRQRIQDAMAKKEDLDRNATWWRELESTAHQVWTSVEQDGSNAFKNIGKTLKSAVMDVLYQMTVKKWIVSLSASISGNAVANTISGAAGNVASSAISSIGSSIFGSVISDSVGGLGGIYSAAAYSGLGQALGLTEAVSTGGMAMTGIGSAIGAALPWVGGALALGSALGLFGGGGEDPHNNAQWSGYDFILNKGGVQGSGNPWSGATVKGPAYTVTGKTSGKGYWSDMYALSADQIAAINQSVKAVFANGAAFASALGVDPSVIDSATVNSGIQGVSTPGSPLTFKSVEDALASLSEAIAVKVIPNLKDFQATGETLATTAQRLQTEFALTNQIAQMMGKSASEVFGANNLSGRDALIQLLGGAGTASTAIGSYYQNYYSASERTLATKGQISATLQGLGISNVPQTRAEFRALVDAQDLTSESGRKMYATLIAVADAFAGITDAAGTTLNTSQFRTRLDFQRAQFGGGTPTENSVIGQIRSLRDETRAMAIALAQANNETARILRRWNGDGMPATRTTA